MTDDPGYASHLNGAGRGVRFVPAEPEAIADELRSLVSDREAWAEAGHAVRRHAEQAFSWALAAERHELIYEELLDQRGEVAQEVVPASSNGAQATTASERGATR
jgi:glycosyltransferase involved in cell wall biosynthesis